MKNMKVMMTVFMLCMSSILVGCNKETIQEFAQDDLVLVSESGNKSLELNQAAYLFEDYTYIENHATYDGTDEEVQYDLYRGIGIGSTLEEYIDMYAADDASIIWEVCYSDNSTEFFEYSGLDKDVPVIEDGALWLDVGFCKSENGWKSLKDFEIANVWFCDVDEDLYEEVVIISVNANSNGKIQGITVNYFDYTQSFIDYQAWEY